MSTHSPDSSLTMVVDPDEQVTNTTPEPSAEVVVKGRNVEVPDHFRTYVSEKLSRLERFDRTIYLFDVELDHERNRRQRKNCQHVEITARGRGPVVRGEACADSFYAALESAAGKLEGRLRRSKDRRKIHYGDKTPVSLAEATAHESLFDTQPVPSDAHAPAEGLDEHEPGRIVRTKEHPARPMTVDDALYEMELVGHDFFLFHDKESDRPSVVYRRHAYDYGLIRLA
ncbi:MULTISPECIES: ribosome hibernation-promoting factor, HPF/YfiA family [unclassified Mycolicibacterium]|uniref:ribosome hibernation-promoting factor, HPF/YfiA family n=1 Tax=unclassified Mycolicibacterium TaxID=2636767 RepID=UPI0012DF4F5A|nr:MULTISPECIES: ribosome-associated translation inhibitor RaiA [unclassified Mycolicibacterium]MUL81011.1 ribosome-associated translation inhibitor RaiA [Mycolicibacterium sp. CBMA 329]MUL86777.1 ribosome-associated translation inhibitor RaiA [Mycolicibacterium sp. CBMA 331]MUL98938.1 ribosome-associated translation inhibitor RaiA [Mycolicibacterium sp. CBMA 334]MUM37074.1 ribosome-associated translation inhibitor RaiA [Mycolicibacterium sp. CBMA 247]MUM42842.1 ribosome-associated translation